MRHEDVVDASQLGVDLEAEVRESLRGRLDHILHLNTLGGHAEEGVSHPLHLSCGEEPAGDQIIAKAKLREDNCFNLVLPRAMGQKKTFF